MPPLLPRRCLTSRLCVSVCLSRGVNLFLLTSQDQDDKDTDGETRSSVFTYSGSCFAENLNLNYVSFFLLSLMRDTNAEIGSHQFAF